jgi:hypothetical protein
MSQPTDQRGNKLYLGSDLIKRTLADHVQKVLVVIGDRIPSKED